MIQTADHISKYCRHALTLTLCFWVCCANASTLADESIRFAHLTTEDGLPQSVVNTITQDRSGFVWFGTQSGLARYDGHRLITHENTTNARNSDGWVWRLEGRAPNNLWFATDSDGLCRQDLWQSNWECLTKANHGLSADSVRAVVAYGQDLWVGTEAGLDRINLNTFKVTNISLPEIPTLAGVHALFADENGDLWVGTRQGQLYQFSPHNNQVVDHSQTMAGRSVTAITQDQQGVVWIATRNHGLFRFHDATFTHFLSDNDQPGSLPSNWLTTLLVADDGDLWVGTYNKGLAKFDRENETFSQFKQSDSKPYSLIDNHIVSLYQDSGKVIWVGTFSGVSRFNPRLDKFTNYHKDLAQGKALANNYVTSFAEESPNLLWIGTHKGVAQVDLTTNQVTTATHSANDPNSLRDNKVFALQVDAAGGLWVGTMTEGLNYKAAGSNRFIDPIAANERLPKGTGVTALLLDQEQQLWVGTYADGLFKVNPSTFSAQQFHPRLGNLPNASLLTLYQDRQGSIWVGTRGDGIMELSASGELLNHYKHDPQVPESLSSNLVYAIHETFAGDLWIGTANHGLNRWSAADRQNKRPRFEHIERDGDLPDSTIHAILSEPDNTLWFSTNAGLVRLGPDLRNPTTFNVTHGLQHSEFNFAAALRMSDGRMIFGGIRGASLFDPSSVTTNPHPPKPALVKISLGNETVPNSSLRSGELTLEHDNADINIEYAALDYTAPQKNRYQYRLLGFNETWSTPSTNNQTNYTNLDPGRYTFQVRASNNDGVWSQSRLQLNLIVRPAPWASTWAKLLYALVGIMLLLILYNYRRWQVESETTIRNKNLSLRREIERRHVQEQALLAEKELNQQYLDIVEVMIVVLDLHGHILRVNQKAERILGFGHQELVGRDFYALFIPTAVQPALHEHFQGSSSSKYFEAPVTTKSGTQRTIAWNTTQPLDPNHRSGAEQDAHFICSGMDITHTRKLERRMSEAQKMEALGGLSRGIAHDFNNILSSILGYAELTRQDIPATSPAETNLRRLETSAIRARELVASILAFSRQEQQDYERINAAAMVKQAMQLIEPICPSNVVLNVQIADATADVAALPSQLLQIMTNLCTNALQAMQAEGGILTIEVDKVLQASNGSVAPSTTERLPGQIESSSAAAELVCLRVSDTGPGIDAHAQRKIFEPFYTTKYQDGGSGLGLAVVEGITHDLGGTINVDSVPNSTSFTVLLPILPPGVSAAEATMPAEADTHEHPPVILFVDDELTVLNIAEQMLNALGYNVLSAASAKEALELLQRENKTINLLITDQRMPNMQGTALAERVADIRPDLPIMLTSGSDMTKSPRICSYLDKPFTQQELATAVQQALQHAAGTDADSSSNVA